MEKLSYHLAWFRNVAEAYGLKPLYGVDREWHEETNIFHFAIGEITIKLDHMPCVLNVPIFGNLMNHRSQISKECCATLHNDLLD